jgi:hypothetical protein
MKYAVFFFMFMLAGCGFTKMAHPEVEVLDKASGKFMDETVTMSANCRSCHDNQSNKAEYYASAVRPNRKTSIDKIDMLKSHTPPGAELRGYDNYADTDFGYYYYYPWWFDNLQTGGLVAGNQNNGNPNTDVVNASTVSKTTERPRTRESYRRSSGRLRLSNPTSTSVFVAPSPTSSGSAGPAGVILSAPSTEPPAQNSNSGDRRSSSSETTNPASSDKAASPSPASDNSSGNSTSGTRRSSGRTR